MLIKVYQIPVVSAKKKVERRRKRRKAKRKRREKNAARTRKLAPTAKKWAASGNKNSTASKTINKVYFYRNFVSNFTVGQSIQMYLKNVDFVKPIDSDPCLSS